MKKIRRAFNAWGVTRNPMPICPSKTTTGTPIGTVDRPAAGVQSQWLVRSRSSVKTMEAGSQVNQPMGVRHQRQHNLTFHTLVIPSSPAHCHPTSGAERDHPCMAAIVNKTVEISSHDNKHQPRKRERPTGKDTGGAWPRDKCAQTGMWSACSGEPFEHQ